MQQGEARGREARARGDWAGARGAFEEALQHARVPEVLEELGLACFRLDDASHPSTLAPSWPRPRAARKKRGNLPSGTVVSIAYADVPELGTGVWPG